MPKGEDRMAKLFAAHSTSAAKIAYLMTGIGSSPRTSSKTPS